MRRLHTRVVHILIMAHGLTEDASKPLIHPPSGKGCSRKLPQTLYPFILFLLGKHGGALVTPLLYVGGGNKKC